MGARKALIAIGLISGAAFGVGFGVGVFISQRWRRMTGWARGNWPGSGQEDVKYGAFRQ